MLQVCTLPNCKHDQRIIRDFNNFWIAVVLKRPPLFPSDTTSGTQVAQPEAQPLQDWPLACVLSSSLISRGLGNSW